MGVNKSKRPIVAPGFEQEDGSSVGGGGAAHSMFRLPLSGVFGSANKIHIAHFVTRGDYAG